MTPLYIMEAANLFCGDADPSKSKHLTLSELALPPLEEIYQTHHAGGALVEIEVPLGVKKIDPSFKLAGWDPDVLSQFGLGSTATNAYTAYGVITDRATGTKVQAKAVMQGRLGKIAPHAFQRGQLQGHDYEIKGVTHYELWFNNQEIFFWNFFSSEWRVNGVSQNATELALLNIVNGG